MNFYMIPNPGLLKASKLVSQYPYQLWLAQWFTGNEELLNRGRQLIQNGVQVILDNGAFENDLQDLDDYVNVISALNPWCVVLPDLPDESAEQSFKATEYAFTLIRDMGYRNELMAAPQGQTTEAVQECAKLISDRLPKCILGLGLCYKQWGDSERDRYRMLLDIMHVVSSRMRIHMLGSRNKGIHPVSFFNRMPRVTGMDTFKPTRDALGTIHLLTDEMRQTIKNSTAVVEDDVLLTHIYNFCLPYGINIFKDDHVPMREVIRECS